MGTEPDTGISTLPAQVERALDAGSLYTAQELATQFNVRSVTVRTRWFEWLKKVAAIDRLKSGSRYTELSKVLFADYSDRASDSKMKGEDWVAEVKPQYEAIAANQAQPVNVEVLPVEGGSLAVAESTLAKGDELLDVLRSQRDALLQEVGINLEDASASEEGVWEQELEAAREVGRIKTILLHKAEKEGREEMAAQMNQQSISKKQQAAAQANA